MISACIPLTPVLVIINIGGERRLPEQYRILGNIAPNRGLIGSCK